MKTFKQYLEENNESSVSTDTLLRIARVAAEDHFDELLSFFQTLAQKDHRIKQELDAYSMEIGNKPHSVKDNKDHLPSTYHSDPHDDTVVPSSADGL